MQLVKLIYGIILLAGFGGVCHLSGSRAVFFMPAQQYHIMADTTQWAEIKMDTLNMVNKMAYADTANFMKQKIYPCARCFLRPQAAKALEKANMLAKKENLRLVIFDCYRPYGYQQKMFEIVNNPKYVAPPGKGSNHNRGVAVDLALADAEGNMLDMGNEFDDFSDLSHYLSDKISIEAQGNRKTLRRIMKKAGFTPYDNEWWHFDYKKKRYDTSDFRWECNE